MNTEHEAAIEQRFEELRDETRRMRRRLRLAIGGLLAAILVLNVAPAAANHLNVKTSDINNGAVTTPKLRNGAVREARINDGAVSTPKLRNGAVGTNKLRDRAVTRAKIRNGAVNRAKLAPHAVTARAYAHVIGTGSVIAESSKNIDSSNVTRPQAGVYCFHDLSFSPHIAVASAQQEHVNAAVLPHVIVGCPASTAFTVLLRSIQNGSPATAAFSIVVF